MRRVFAADMVLALTLLVGCATPQHNYQPQSVEISEPALGSVNTAAVGDELLRQGHYADVDAIHLEKPVTIGGLGAKYTLAAGHYLKIGDGPEGDFYSPGSGTITTSGIARADTVQAILVPKDGNGLCIVLAGTAKACSHEGVLATHIHAKTAGRDSFQRTLIYNGKVGGKINIAYREFSGDFARPDFSNNVEYDLGESNLIAYKGAELEVLEATNQFIRYKVIRNFNRAQF
jgi:hypothetical protein